MEQTYKNKYLQLKSQYMNSVDVAFRLGYEQGKKDAQLDQMAQEQQQQDAMMAQQAGASGDPNQMGQEQPGQNAGANGAPEAGDGSMATQAAPGQQSQDSEHPDGTELDQHIAKLESMLGKSDANPADLAKAMNEIKALRKAQVDAINMKKSAEAIKGIALALHKPQFKLSSQASHNMNDNAKKAVTLQHKIVEDAMKKWEEEEKKVSKGIHEIIQVEGFTKKE